MKPTKGRTVNYGIEDGDYLAAIITGVDDDNLTVSLCVLGASGMEFLDAEFSEKLEEGKWSWPVITK